MTRVFSINIGYLQYEAQSSINDATLTIFHLLLHNCLNFFRFVIDSPIYSLQTTYHFKSQIHPSTKNKMNVISPCNKVKTANAPLWVLISNGT